MQIDVQTLQDLEIHGATFGAPSLVDVLDRTRTRGGRDSFRRRILHPLGSAQAIRDVQTTLQFVSENRNRFDALPDQEQAAALTRYLDSRFATLTRVKGPSLFFESWWIRVRYRDLFDEARRGTALMRAFLDQVRTLFSNLDDAPALLGELAAEAMRILQRPGIERLRSTSTRLPTPKRVLIGDHIARETERLAVRRLIEILFEIDALVSMSDVTAEKGFIFPRVDDDYAGIELHHVYHPFLKQPVVNDLQLRAGTRLLFLTGPNMAGKTTYLKACGIAVVLAHSGMGVPAREARVGVADRLISAIRTEDSLREGVSYFQAEARRVKEMARHLADGQRCIIIVDELFRGTNVKDACNASLTVLQTFAGARNGRFLVASHLIELAADLELTPGVLLSRFEAAANGEDLSFDYRIKAGVSSQRLGMIVLEKEGVLDALATIRATV